ncbi:MAG: hypothetical protein GF381_04545 [Candidatus Pacebacteria bacterium]|nr:hypothetical protein [Candidatus Paceibacterota bacterium]
MKTTSIISDQLRPVYIREQVIKACRSFFDQQGFHEVITPVLNWVVPAEPTLTPFTTTWHDLTQDHQLFLPCSPELALKKSLAQGIEPCYSLAPSFRNQEPADADHHPEFLMLEWYRSGVSYKKIMKDCQELVLFILDWLQRWQERPRTDQIEYQGKKHQLAGNWPILSLAKLFNDQTGCTIKQVEQLEQLVGLAQELGFETQAASWEQLFNQIFINLIEPKLPVGPLFLVDFPAQISPLCTQQPNRPELAERFEFYLAGIELANGNNEQTQLDKIERYFKVSPDFAQVLKKLAAKLYAGAGLGVERLAMILAGQTKLSNLNPLSLNKQPY